MKNRNIVKNEMAVLGESVMAIIAEQRVKQRHRRGYSADGRRVIDLPHPGYYTAARVEVKGKSGARHALRIMPWSGTVYAARFVSTKEKVMVRVPVETLKRRMTRAERDLVTIDPETSGATVPVLVEQPVVREVWMRLSA